MKILCITDLHGDRNALDHILARVGDVDVILLGGDITNFGTANEAEAFVGCAQQACPTVLAVAGNCDSRAIDQRLTDLGVSLFGRGVVHEGIGFHGVSAMTPWMGSMYELTEDEIAAALASGQRQLNGNGPSVVLSHAPPRDTRVDRTRLGCHVGSRAVRELIESARPLLVVCGHIHEARGIDTLGPTTIVNCGPAFRGSFAIAFVDEAVRVELRKVG